MPLYELRGEVTYRVVRLVQADNEEAAQGVADSEIIEEDLQGQTGAEWDEISEVAE